MHQATHNKIVSFIWGIADMAGRPLATGGLYHATDDTHRKDHIGVLPTPEEIAQAIVREWVEQSECYRETLARVAREDFHARDQWPGSAGVVALVVTPAQHSVAYPKLSGHLPGESDL